MATVQKTTGNVTYLYDPAAQRVAKTANGVTTHYIRDASGNVMAIYENGALKELPIYGSSRLGVYRVLNGDLQNDRNKLILGRREYELSNHLGNVLATVSDVKLPAARVLSFTDYYAFGSAMPGRSGGAGYRYGFNTQEKSPELAPDHYTAEFWEYDARIGRRWNLDPVDQISISNYAVNGNSPISLNDPYGDCAKCNDQQKKELEQAGMGSAQIASVYQVLEEVTVTAPRDPNQVNVPAGYNRNSWVSPHTGEYWGGYDMADLRTRSIIFSANNPIKRYIERLERYGIAEPIAYRNAVNYYGGERRLQMMAGLSYAEAASGFMSGGGSLMIRGGTLMQPRKQDFGHGSITRDVAVPGAIQYGDKNDLFLTHSSKATQPDGVLDIAIHGNSTSVEIGKFNFDHRVLANLIKRNPQFSGQSIRLLSCNTGALPNGFAKNLANKLGVQVTAPNNFIWAWPNGKLGVYPMSTGGTPILSSPGSMVPFNPGKIE